MADTLKGLAKRIEQLEERIRKLEGVPVVPVQHEAFVGTPVREKVNPTTMATLLLKSFGLNWGTAAGYQRDVAHRFGRACQEAGLLPGAFWAYKKSEGGNWTKWVRMDNAWTRFFQWAKDNRLVMDEDPTLTEVQRMEKAVPRGVVIDLERPTG